MLHLFSDVVTLDFGSGIACCVWNSINRSTSTGFFSPIQLNIRRDSFSGSATKSSYLKNRQTIPCLTRSNAAAYYALTTTLSFS